jgi:hypothetical protein
MFTLNRLLSIFEENNKLTYEGTHYESGEHVWTGDLWRLWPAPEGETLETKNQRRLSELMECKGMQLRFYDETISDSEGLVHETQPSYYGRTPTFNILNCEVWSRREAEANPERYLEDLLSCDHNVADSWEIDFAQFGFVKFDYQAESGFHHGQTDTPESVKKLIQEKFPDCEEFVFSIDSVGQFDVHFTAWYRLPEKEETED